MIRSMKHAVTALFLALALLPAVAQAQESAAEGVATDTLGAVEMSAVDVQPAFVDAVEAARVVEEHYPPALKSAGVSERVLVRLLVDTLGRARVPRVENPGGHAELEAAAVRAVGEIRFVPARWAGVAYPVWVDLLVVFAHPAPPPAIGSAAITALASENYAMSPVEKPPELRNRDEVARAIALNFPPEMRAAGITGTVTLRFQVDVEGNPGPARIEKSSRPAFVEAAARVIQAMRFRPARVGGRPVNVWVTLPIMFDPAMSPPPRGRTRQTQP